MTLRQDQGTVVLGIDTSGVVCAGVAVDGAVMASGSIPDTRAHAEQLMPLVQQVMADAGLTLAEVDRIAVGVGPGPFTGLRVGVVAAITLGEALGVPVRGVCSLDVLAQQAERSSGDFVVATDARRKEWYWASYDADGRRVHGPFVSSPDALPELTTVGPVTENPVELDAGVLAAITDSLPDAGLEPLYLRRPDAEVPTARKSTLLPPRLAPRRVR